MRWLAGKTHTLAEFDWSTKKMATAIDRLLDALVEIEKDGKKILDEKYMMSIFTPLKLKQLDKYMIFVFEVKKSPTTNRKGCDSRQGVKALGPYIYRELFQPIREENKATTKNILKWGLDIAKCLLEEMKDPTKLTSEHLSSLKGRLN